MSELAADLLAALAPDDKIIVRWPDDPETEEAGGRVIVLTWDDEGGDGEYSGVGAC